MSKRFITSHQHGERKKPRLNITISDHNFPLSQNIPDNQADTWGDDNDDEMLLLASQACEQACTSSNISSLPDYTMFMPPVTTSTQIFDEPQPSTSKMTNFNFKKPLNNPTHVVSSSDLKDKCHRIVSPLQSFSNKMSSMKESLIVSDDLIMNDKIYKDDDPEHMYRQLLQFQEDNAKLKSENGKLLEKCVTKEGEVSILRTQLKTCQVSVDNARLERVKAQEKIQMEFTEKLSCVKNEIHDLRTQLDFKNLEIISVKERCRMLESSKIKLTQVTVAGNDTSFRHNTSASQAHHGEYQQQNKKVASTISVQTDKLPLVKLNKRCYFKEPTLSHILPLILKCTQHKQYSVLEYNENLRKPQDYSQTKCRIFSTFHRIPTTPVPTKCARKAKITLNSILEELTYITSSERKSNELIETKYINVFKHVHEILCKVVLQLEDISQRITAAFQREMDEKYMEYTNVFIEITTTELLLGEPLYKDEQAILARRAVATLASILCTSKTAQLLCSWESNIEPHSSEETYSENFIDLLCKICNLFDSSVSGLLYSGFLMSVVFLLGNAIENVQVDDNLYRKSIVIVKHLIKAQLMPAFTCKLLGLMKKLSLMNTFLSQLCANSTSGNLKMDYDQGVMLYKRETCTMQIFLKQIEVALKCLEKHKLLKQTVITCQNVLGFFSNINLYNPNWIQDHQTTRCDCALITTQVVVYALNISANFLKQLSIKHDLIEDFKAICRCGLTILYQWVLRDIEFSSQLGFNQGHYHIFIEICSELKDRLVLNELQGNMLTELVSTLQPACEDIDLPPSPCQQVWINSFSNFSLAD